MRKIVPENCRTTIRAGTKDFANSASLEQSICAYILSMNRVAVNFVPKLLNIYKRTAV